MSVPTPPPPIDPPSYGTPAPPPSFEGGGGGKQVAMDKVKGPAISLMVVAGLSFVLEILNILANLLGVSLMGAQDMSQFEGMKGMEWLAPLMSGGFVVIFGVIGLAAMGLIFFGAMKMKALESYGLAMTAAILSMIPCFTVCCLGIPFGIWALVVLLNDEVKSAFD